MSISAERVRRRRWLTQREGVIETSCVDRLLRSKERSVREDRLYILRESVGLLEDLEEEEDWENTGKLKGSASRCKVRALGSRTDMGGDGQNLD